MAWFSGSCERGSEPCRINTQTLTEELQQAHESRWLGWSAVLRGTGRRVPRASLEEGEGQGADGCSLHTMPQGTEELQGLQDRSLHALSALQTAAS